MNRKSVFVLVAIMAAMLVLSSCAPKAVAYQGEYAPLTASEPEAKADVTISLWMGADPEDGNRQVLFWSATSTFFPYGTKAKLAAYPYTDYKGAPEKYDFEIGTQGHWDISFDQLVGTFVSLEANEYVLTNPGTNSPFTGPASSNNLMLLFSRR